MVPAGILRQPEPIKRKTELFNKKNGNLRHRIQSKKKTTSLNSRAFIGSQYPEISPIQDRILQWEAKLLKVQI